MAKSKSVLKEFFKSGKIPIESNFADLIDKIPVGGESNKDTTLTTFDTENPYVRGYRFIVLDDSLTYLIFGLYNDTERVILPYIVIKCHTANPIEQSESIPVTYAILTGNQMMNWYLAIGAQLHEVDDATLINNMPSDLVWNPINSNPIEKDNFNHNILNICTNINGTFSTFVFNLADINFEGNSKTLPIELMVIIDDNTRFTVDGPYYIKDTAYRNSFSVDWDALILVLDKSYGTITTTNNMVVTKCNNIKNNYMEKR